MKINKKILISTLCTGVIGVSVPLTVSLSSINKNQTNLNSVSGSQTSVVDNNNGLNQTTTNKENYLNKDNNKLNNNNVVDSNIVESNDNVINKSEVESNEIELIQNFKTEIGLSSIKNYTNYSTDTEGYVIHGLVQNPSLRNKSVNEINKYLNINSFKKSLSLSAFKSVVETIGGLTNVNKKNGGMYSFNGDEHNFDQYNKVDTDVKILKSQNNKAVYSIRVTPRVNYYWDTNTKDNKPIVYLITTGPYVYDENDNSEQELIANRKLFYVSNNFELLDLNKNVFNGNIIFHQGINDIKVIDETKMFQPLFDDSVKKVVLPSSLEELTITSTNDLSKLDFSNCVNLKKLTISTDLKLDLSLLNTSYLQTLEYLSVKGQELNLDYVNNSVLPNLKSLKFQETKSYLNISLFNPNDFLNLEELEFITSAYNLRDVNLSNNTKLKVLKITSNDWWNRLSSLPILGDNTNYKEISITAEIPPCNVVSQWKDIHKQSNLEKLSIRGTHGSTETDYTNFDFSGLQSVKSLYIEAGEFIRGWEKLFTTQNFPNLEELYVKNRYLGVDPYWNNFPNLKSIGIEDTAGNSNSYMDMSKIDFSKFNQLESFTMKTNSSLNVNLDFTKVNSNDFFKNLKSLELKAPIINFGSMLDDSTVFNKLNNLTIGTSQNIDFVSKIKDSNVSQLNLSFEPLSESDQRNLDLSNYKNLKDLSIGKYFTNSNQNRKAQLTSIDISNTNLNNFVIDSDVFFNSTIKNLNLDNANIKTALLSGGFDNISSDNTSIEYFNYSNNLNENLDLSVINNLKWLISTNDILSTYDLTKLDKLENIDIRNNKNVLKVDITSLSNLNSISVKDSNPYVKVDTSTNKNLFYKYFDNDLVEWN